MPVNNSEAAPTRVRGSYLVALVVLAAGLVVTYVAYQVTLDNETKARQARFAQDADAVTNALDARFSQYLALLDSSAGLFGVAHRVRRSDWQNFADSLSLRTNYPGISSLEYLQFVTHADLPEFLRTTRADDAPGFQLQQSGDRPFYCLITYDSPRNTNRASEGFDACQAKVGFSVLTAARDSGINTVSGPLHLLDEKNAEHLGVVAVRAMYRKGADLSSVAARSAALQGWVGETMPIDRVVAGIVPTGIPLDIDIRDAAVAGDASVLYQKRSRQFGADYWGVDIARIQPSYSTTATVGARTWVVQFSEPPAVAGNALLIALAGVLISIPLALLVLNLGLMRSRALKLAEHMTESLRDQEQLLSSITSNISDGIYRSTPDKGMIYANDALARMFGYASAAELMSAAGPILYADPRRRGDLELLLDTHGRYHDQEVEYQRKDGTRFFGLNSAITVAGSDGKSAYFDGVISDITERKRADEKVFQLAHYDSLTGLPNRTLMRDRLQQAMHDASRRNTHLALLFLDLDRFKTVNDSLGHDVGDELLKAVAGRLGKEVRESDTVSRQGGDEFILILRDIAGATGAARVAEAVLQAVAKPYHIGRHELHITPSIGVALFPDDTDDIEMLIRSADAAMYHAKENGRFNFQFFTPELNARAYERLSLENSLRQALERREFSLHYQPQVDLKGGQISGMEALLRWNSPERGPVPPAVFVPILESSGLIGAVGEWVLQEACHQNRSWQDAGLPALPVSVNLSAFQFRRRNMADVVADVLAESGLSAAYLELEFTESAVMQETREISDTIRRLNALGVRLAIDDFGTGYSSLSYLKRFRIQKIKIDQSFIRDIHLDPDDAAITTAIISLARNLKLMVVAEGVETREQYEFLRDHGCDGVQGFYFSVPVPAARFAELVLKERQPA